MSQKIVLEAEDGSKVTAFVEEETKINGTSYLLVSDSDEEDANAFILKDVSGEDEEEAVYEFVEDEEEFEAVAAIFKELLDDECDLTDSKEIF